MDTKTDPRVFVRNMREGHETFGIWEVVEELAATAYEHGTKTISMSQITKELNNVELNSPSSIEEVRNTLIELGYRVEMQKV
jgi:hypothetical protein